jgi:hypothetical protein
MGLMDKVTAQATQLAQKTQETARDSKAKFDQAQANWRADAMLRNLGAVAYAERTGRGSPDARAQIDKLVHDISAHKTQHGISLASQPADQAGQETGADAEPGAGAETDTQPGADAGAETGADSFPGGAADGVAAGTGARFPPQADSTGFPPEGGAGRLPARCGAGPGLTRAVGRRA